MELKEENKRLNLITGKPFEQGFVDENGRVFYAYVNKIGNDGWYLEEWKKDMEAYNSKKRKEVTNAVFMKNHLVKIIASLNAILTKLF